MPKIHPHAPRILFLTLGLLGNAWGWEQAKVLSATPVYKNVPVTQQVCTTQPMVVQPPKSGAGALMGAIAGGAIGNSIGHGSGNAAATMAGVMGGAIVGDRIEGQPSVVQNVQTCSPEVTQHSQLAYYDVRYEFAGKQYEVHMQQDPGPVLNVNVTPQVQGAAMPAPALVAPPATVVTPTTTVIATPVYAAPAVYPYGYPYAYSPYPFALSVGVGVGFGHGYHHR